MSLGHRTALFSVALSLALPSAWAGTMMGWGTIDSSFPDLAGAEVFSDNFFHPGTRVDTFSLFADQFVGQQEMTPTLFERTSPGVSAVQAGNMGDMVSASVLAHVFAFGLQYKPDPTPHSNYTFGFMNAFVDSRDMQSFSSAGVVDFAPLVMGATGVGGAGITNAWVFTPSGPNISISLGPTFGISGQPATFALNNNAFGGALIDRTFSVDALDAPEPGSFSLAAIGTILITGAVLFRRKRLGWRACAESLVQKS